MISHLFNPVAGPGILYQRSPHRRLALLEAAVFPPDEEQRGDVVGLGEAHVREAAAGVGAAVHAVAPGRAVAAVALAGADPDDAADALGGGYTVLLGERNAEQVGAVLVRPGDEIMLITEAGTLVRTGVDGINVTAVTPSP